MFFVNNEQTKVFKLDFFSQKRMCPDHEVQLAFLQSFHYFFFLLSGAEPVDVIYTGAHGAQSFLETMTVLQRENSRRYQHSNLLTISDSFESCTNSYFRFSKSYITADKTVHWMWFFHILLDILCCFKLVRCILVDKGCFEFILQIAIRSECIAGCILTQRIELDELARDVLNFGFSLSLEILPCVRSEFTQHRFSTVFAYKL